MNTAQSSLLLPAAGQDGSSFRASFSAEETLIQVIPDFTASPTFMAGVPATVPLWQAELLQTRSLGRIVLPEWLSVDKLRPILQQEKTQPLLTTSLPFYYYEITRKLTNRPRHDDTNPDVLRLLVEDIFQVRVEKLRQQFPAYLALMEDQEIPKVDVPGIASAELALLGPFLLQALGDRALLLHQKETTTTTKKNDSVEEGGESIVGEPIRPKVPLRRFRR
ncbi:GINS complex subunit 2 [Fistulifera solaris]|uniref:GINS complex subunit 2 n=1 Tax=Fistulifera solaris TaxID=1519565 RepID=A0A1Z5JXB0_FISSO|nr:GINS complex subunit 2 [Fistulifera solaris]|eukprot:GAX18381.1 GINS complex subunit 2 [Fistulifera solaris]